MSDVVYRQAAIDAVSSGCKELRGIFADCEKNLNELPAADPEVVRCKDCKYWPYATKLFSEEELYYETYRWCFDIGEKGGEGFCSKGERRDDG